MISPDGVTDSPIVPQAGTLTWPVRRAAGFPPRRRWGTCPRWGGALLGRVDLAGILTRRVDFRRGASDNVTDGQVVQVVPDDGV